MNRKPPPFRRPAETVEFDHEGMSFTATLGRPTVVDPVCEVFLNNAHLGSVMDSLVRDAAIALSFALQYGADVKDLRHAMTRNLNGDPSSPLGHILDLIEER